MNVGAEALAREKPQRPSGLASRAWHWFISIKVGLILLLIISVLSFIGMLVPQGGEPAQYVEKYGRSGAALITALGLNNAYHSWWYQLALLVLAVNITSCTIWRMPRAIRTAFKRQWLGPDRIQALGLKKVFVAPVDAEAASAGIRKALAAGRYSVAEKRSGEMHLFSATRGGISRLGATVVHIGLVVTLLGGVYGGRKGWSKLVFGAPGETIHSPDGSFDVRVDDFKILKNPDGSVKDYISVLSVLEGGREVISKRNVEVNRYLGHRGINIYQSSYSALPEKFNYARLRVQYPDGRLSEPFEAPYQKQTAVPGSSLKVTVESFAADFRIDTETHQAYSASLEPRNPAIRANLVDGDRDLGGQWAFLSRESMHVQEGVPQVQFIAYDPMYATGLDFARNPAVPIVWTGFAFMSLGVLPMLVLMTHRRIWVAVVPEGGRSRIVSGGAVNKHREMFQRDFYRLMDGVENVNVKEASSRGRN